MRAVVANEYGGPDVLQVGERPDPKVWADAVLVKVAASSLNPVDWKVVRGYLETAFPTILPLIPGWDVAGEVVAVGPTVTHVQPGQRVFGYARKDYIGDGTWADLVAVPARGVAPAPESLDHVEASCLPLAGLTAYQALVDRAGLISGETVLVHAASGGVGHLAVQIALARRARVIGTASERNHDYLRRLGVEPVEYGEGLAERVRSLAPEGVDVVLDLVGGDALEVSPGLVKDVGRLVSVVDAATALRLGGQYHFVAPDVDDLAELARLADDGKLRPHVDARYDLVDVQKAVEHAERGGFRGKIVLET